MSRNILLCTLMCLLLGGLPSSTQAIDGNPSKKTVPTKFWNPGGKRFSIFQGDPERIRRANEVRIKDFEPKLAVNPNPITINSDPSVRTSINITFSYRNTGKKTYTLSFPDAKRYDMRIVRPGSDEVLWQWSADKVFEQSEGSLMVNPRDMIAFEETIYTDQLANKGTPGHYVVQAIVANYPEIRTEFEFEIRPAVPIAPAVQPVANTSSLPQ